MKQMKIKIKAITNGIYSVGFNHEKKNYIKTNTDANILRTQRGTGKKYGKFL